MSGPVATLTPLPTGGAALLQFYGSPRAFDVPANVTTLTIARSGTDGSSVTIYSGPPVPVYVDINDGPSTSSQPLNVSVEYTWTVTDANGSVTLGPTACTGSILTVPDGLTQILIRLLQAACDNAPRPTGVMVNPAQVGTRGPVAGWQATPFVVVNLALFQQADTAVGQDVLVASPENIWTLPGWCKRVWQVSVLSQDADERDFYRDSLLAAFRALKATFFNFIGQNIVHSYQATSGTTGDEWLGQSPIFYWAELMFTLEGQFSVEIATGFGLIETIDVAVTSSASSAVTMISDEGIVKTVDVSAVGDATVVDQIIIPAPDGAA